MFCRLIIGYAALGLQVLRLDLHDDHDVSIFLEMLSSANVCLAHFGPPCGTASRARERPLPPQLAHVQACPLRSDESPFGLPGLRASQAARVQAAKQALCHHARVALDSSCPRELWSAARTQQHLCSGGSRTSWRRTCPTHQPGIASKTSPFMLACGVPAETSAQPSGPPWACAVAFVVIVMVLMNTCLGHLVSRQLAQSFPRRARLSTPRSWQRLTLLFSVRALQARGLKTAKSYMASGVARPRDLRSFTKKRAPPLSCRVLACGPRRLCAAFLASASTSQACTLSENGGRGGHRVFDRRRPCTSRDKYACNLRRWWQSKLKGLRGRSRWWGSLGNLLKRWWPLDTLHILWS